MKIPTLAVMTLLAAWAASPASGEDRTPPVGDGIPVFRTPPGFDQRAWDRLLRRAAARGEIKRTQGNDGMPLLYRTLKRVTPNDPNLPRQAEYLSIVYLDDPGMPQPLHVSVVSETWSKNAKGEWVVDQRTYKSHVAGHLVQTDNWRIAQKPILDESGRDTGGAEVGDILPLDAPDPQSDEGLKAWGEKIKEWNAALFPEKR